MACIDVSLASHMAPSIDSEASSSDSGSGRTEIGSSSASEVSSEEFVPKVELPSRSTRGSRLKGLLDEQDSADEDFWKQEFFSEEARDDKYRTESESEDVADTDFSESEVISGYVSLTGSSAFGK